MAAPLESSPPVVADCLCDSTKLKRQKIVRVASFDGGGIRGILPSMFIDEIERRTSKLAFELFDILGGASTGAIVSMGLGMGLPAKIVTQLFEEKAKEIFQTSSWTRVTSCDYMTESKYGEGENLVKVINEFSHGYLFKDLLREVVIPTYEITEAEPWYLRRDVAKKDPAYQDLRVVDVIRATTAAPTYFNPKPLTINDHQYAFIDGGMFDNNPSSATCRFAREALGPSKELFVCSFGTGIFKTKIPYTGPKHWGKLGWATSAIDIILQATSEAIDAEMQAGFNREYSESGFQHYYRFQTEVDEKHSALDDASKGNIDYLVEKGKELIEERNDDLEAICSFLEKEADIEEE